MMRPPPLARPMLSSPWHAVLLASFVPLAVKAITYAAIGSVAPLLVLLLLGGTVGLGLHRGGGGARRLSRIWAMLMVLWAVARLVVLLLFQVVPMKEAHVTSQFTAWYLLLSLAYLGGGLYLYRRAPKRPTVTAADAS